MPRIAWVGMGLLLIAALLLSLGRRETQSFPAADSYSPSGASAFVQLLKSQGYDVVDTKTLRPRLRENDLVVAFRIPEPQDPISLMQEVANEEEKPQSEFEKAYNRELMAHVRDGGRALLLPVPRDYLDASRTQLKAKPISVTAKAGVGKLQITPMPSAYTDNLLKEIYETHPRISLWVNGAGQPVVTGVKVGKGAMFILSDGILATNRFIDQNQNAELLLRLVQTLAPKGGRIVFTEASFGNVQEMGLLESIGPWADAAWQQFLILALVVAFTLGKRLGLPEESKTRQRGSRELVDAIAATMQRANKPQLAMRTALTRADAELRSALKLPRDADRIKRDELLPSSLARTIAMVEVASKDPAVPAWDAARKIKKLDQEVAEFLGPRRRGPRRRKSV